MATISWTNNRRESDGRMSGQPPSCGSSDRNAATHGDTFSISALHLSIKVPYFSNSGHKNEKVTSYLATRRPRPSPACRASYCSGRGMQWSLTWDRLRCRRSSRSNTYYSASLNRPASGMQQSMPCRLARPRRSRRLLGTSSELF
eukprot:SAG31_NODE_1548_length_7914_cov_5.353423_12_plen_145_part_00